MKNKEWATEEIKGLETEASQNYPHDEMIEKEIVLSILNQLDEPEVLSQEWVDAHKKHGRVSSGIFGDSGLFRDYVLVKDLEKENLLVPKQEEVDRAYKDGYEKGKQYTFYKGYLEGVADKESEPETVADVITDFYKSLERLKEVLGTEVEELKE